jgi:hypothetical protein
VQATAARLAWALVASTVPWIAAAQTNSVTISSPQPLSKTMQKLLVDLAQLKSTSVPEGVDPYAVLRTYCGGSVTNDYLAHVATQNPGFQLRVEPGARTIALPPCIRVAKDRVINPLPRETVESLTLRTFGVTPTEVVQICNPNDPKPKELPACRLPASRALVVFNGPLTQARLSEKKPLRVPTVALPTTFALKPGVTVDSALEMLNAEIARSSGELTAPVVKPPAGLRLIQPLAGDDPVVTGSACALDNQLPRPWPVDVDRIGARLQASLARSRAEGRYKKPTALRIADTGFLGLGGFLPNGSFFENTEETDGLNQDSDDNAFNGDRYGIDADGGGNISPYPTDAHHMHGTQVADSALGGATLRAKFAALYDLVKLSFVKIYVKDSGGAVSVRDSTFLDAMRDIKHHADAQVVNYSVGSGSRNSTADFEGVLAQAVQREFLVVLAAGNSPVDLGEFPSYPASFGGNGSYLSSWIITVGAVTPDGGIAPFSSWSSSRVDMLAPGCRIPFAYPGQPETVLHGTSFAAPFVSFSAAVVHALGVPVPKVKRRLIASADFRPQLSERTRFGGIVLNMERAFALFDDALRIKGDVKDLPGQWQRPDGQIEICSDKPPMNPRRILAVWSFEQGGVTQLRVLRDEQDGSPLDPIYCNPGRDRIRFVKSDGDVREPEWKDVEYFVPAHRF